MSMPKKLTKPALALATLALAAAGAVGTAGAAHAALPVGPPSSGAPAAAKTTVSQADQVIAYAQAQLGKPYVWGGAGPDGFDCSGLTMRAYQQAGISLPHNAEAQWTQTAGSHIDRASLSPGDLVFFAGYKDMQHPGHVGIYVGDGQMIDAQTDGVPVGYHTIDRQDYIGAAHLLSDSTTPVDGKQFTTWGTGIRIHSDATLGSPVVSSLAGPTDVVVSCEKHGDTVTAEGYTNDGWSYLPAYGGYITNIYITDSRAWFDELPTC